MKIDALGLIEVRGFVVAIEAADAMLKSANVKLLMRHEVRPGLVSLVVEGDLAACRVAVDAGTAAAQKLGEVVSRLEIGRPDHDTERMVLGLLSSSANSAVSLQPKPSKNGKSLRSPVAAKRPPKQPTPRSDNPPLPVLESILAFIRLAAKGRSWNEIVKRFPTAEIEKRILDDEVAMGRLQFVDNRYRIPEEER